MKFWTHMSVRNSVFVVVAFYPGRAVPSDSLALSSFIDACACPSFRLLLPPSASFRLLPTTASLLPPGHTRGMNRPLPSATVRYICGGLFVPWSPSMVELSGRNPSRRSDVCSMGREINKFIQQGWCSLVYACICMVTHTQGHTQGSVDD